MNAAGAAPPPPLRGGGSFALLLVVAGLFGYLSSLPALLGVVVAVAGVALAEAAQRLPRSELRSLSPLPAVGGLVAVAVASPLGLVPELVAGASGVALLVWLADDPARPAGGVRRARNSLAIPTAAVGIAWASALFLPSSSASLGVAVGLIVFVLAAVAYLLGQPALFDREEPSAS